MLYTTKALCLLTSVIHSKMTSADLSTADLTNADLAGAETTIAGTVSGEAPLRRLGFGSCAKQFRGDMMDELWHRLRKEERVEGWLWTGDAGYPRHPNPEVIAASYHSIKERDSYQTFRESLHFLDGTWDDHDYGLNDAGSDFLYKEESRNLFLDFLDVPKEDPRRFRSGIYTTLLIGPPGQRVKILLLDTRYNRDPHFLSAPGSTDIPGGGLLGSALRWFGATFGLGSHYAGTILGEQQWDWLSEELSMSEEAQVTILVSSIQVFTRLPLTESWGHFPQELNRLVSLLNSYDGGMIIVSGDVHFGQLLVTPTSSSIVEVTSSGLTHSVSDVPLLGGILSNLLLPLYNVRQMNKASSLPGAVCGRAGISCHLAERNYGTMEFEWQPGGGVSVNVTVHSLQSPRHLHVPLHFENATSKNAKNAGIDILAIPLIPKITVMEICFRMVLFNLCSILAVCLLCVPVNTLVQRMERGNQRPGTGLFGWIGAKKKR